MSEPLSDMWRFERLVVTAVMLARKIQAQYPGHFVQDIDNAGYSDLQRNINEYCVARGGRSWL